MGEYVEPFVPEGVLPSFRQLYQFCVRLRECNWRPDFVIDVGASTGIWSGTVSEVFTDARFLLCDPLFHKYKNPWVKPNQERIEKAVADKPGTVTFDVSDDLYGSSFVAVEHKQSALTVPVTTIDQIVAERKLEGRCLIKADVQFAEHLVIEGALETIRKHCDFIILELTVERVVPEARDLLEVANRLSELGFRITDIVGSWRKPDTGEAHQFDVAFMRKDMKLSR